MRTELIIISIDAPADRRLGIPRVDQTFAGMGGYGMSTVIEDIMLKRPDLIDCPDSKVEQYYLPEPKAFLEYLAANYSDEVEEWGGGVEVWALVWTAVEKNPGHIWWMHIVH